MPLLTKNHFTCQLPGCDVEFYFDPGRQGAPPPVWEPGIQARLNKVVAITYSLTGYTTFWCCDEHAIEGIKAGQHLPPLPAKVAPATEAEMNAAKRGMKIVDDMRGAKPS